MNKKVLIALAIILVIAIVSLAFYAYKLNQEITLGTAPNSSANQVQKELKNKNDTEDEDLNELKDKMENIQVNNDSFNSGKIGESFSEEEKQQVIEYAKEVTSGNLKISEGKIAAVQNSYIKVDFRQDSFSWQSNVLIDQNTKLLDFNTQENLSFSSFKAGDSVIVRTAFGGVTDKEFTASKIFKK